MHHVLVRAIVTGFGLSLGQAIYKKVAKRLGIDEEPQPAQPQVEPGADAEQPA